MAKLLSVCMIVKNEEENLSKTLPLVMAGADEVIVVDTGSTDRTKEIAQQAGAKLYEFPWINDFSAARNESLKHAESQYILWLDADEYVSPQEFEKLRQILKHESADIWHVKIWECQKGETKSDVYYKRDKIFKTGKGFHFVRPVNEELHTDEKVTREEVDFNICHWGGFSALDEKAKARKIERGLAMFESALAKNPNDPQFAYLLAGVYFKQSNFEKAAAAYQRAVELLPEGEIKTRARCQLSRCFILLKQTEKALKIADDACLCDPLDPEPRVVKATLLLSADRDNEVVEILAPIAGFPVRGGESAPVNVRLYDYYPYYLMGMAFLKLRLGNEALEHFRLAYKAQPEQKVLSIIQKLENIND
ncbi:MAG: glycosyltransferase [Candidatus Margulisbacteria bacterium]|nr:glycosyltransferase [Candidatus Margulisiibacteriota bacterium]